MRRYQYWHWLSGRYCAISATLLHQAVHCIKLKIAIRVRLVITCCHFGQADHGMSPRPHPIWTWTFSHLITEVFEILTGRFYFDWHRRFSRSGNPLTNCMRIKPSHLTLLGQSNLCIPGNRHCDSECRQTKEVRSE